MSAASRRLAVLYEHPEWFGPLFAELDRRQIDYDRILATDLNFNPAQRPAYALVLNRMSPSSYVRGHGHAIFASLAYLRSLSTWGVPVVNGVDAFALELSKTTQISLLSRLGLPHPRTRVVNTPRQAVEAARYLDFPILVKPNIGGSGAKIQRFDSQDQIEAALAAGTIDLGIDETALVQEYHAPVGGYIVRVEVLDGRFLYAIKVFPNPSAGFNLCPADICQTDGTVDVVPPVVSVPGRAAVTAAASPVDLCPVDLPKTNLKVEGYRPPQEIIDEVLHIARAATIDVGGIEYVISERDGRRYFYDINALSNFVTDAPRVVGFDPVPVFVDYLVK
ncbi:MAG: ATP-grasp domain-containing protein, partial [Candidatus Methylomirabilaceae bacterium]